MSEVVLDSSVILAVIKGEKYRPDTIDILEGAVMSAVNLAEVWTKLYDLSMSAYPAVASVLALLNRIEPFTASQARIAADLRATTRKAGLALGDRACLALAREINAPVFTAEKVWADVETGCRIHLIC